MSSDDNSTNVLEMFPVIDSRFKTGGDKIGYGVKKGCDNVIVRAYEANSKSTNQISWNVKSTSLQSYLDRCLLVEVKLNFKITGTTVDKNLQFFYGMDNATANAHARDAFVFNNFPFNRMLQSTNIAINSANQSYNSNDLNDMSLRLIDKESLRYYADSTVVEPATLAEYTLTGVNSASANSVFNDGRSYSEHFKPNGSYVISDFVSTPATATTAGSVTFSATFMEPIIHPYCALKYGKSAQSNVNNIDVTMILRDIKQAILRSAGGPYGTAATDPTAIGSFELTSVESAKLHITYLAPPLFLPLSTKSVVPYNDVKAIQNKLVTGVPAGADLVINSDTISLNSMPNKIAVFCRLQNSDAGNDYALMRNLTIKSINVSMGRSGMMADFNAYELYMMSKKNSWQGDWAHWTGAVALSTNVVSSANVALSKAYSTGPLLIMDPIYDLGLPSSISSGSVGNFDLQLNVTFTNSTNVDLSAKNCEFFVVAFSDAVLINTLGSSFTYSNLLSKEQALSQDGEPSIEHDAVRELIGGGWFSNLTSLVKKGFQNKHVKGLLKEGVDRLPLGDEIKGIAKGLIGNGRSAGAFSSGSMSAGGRYR